MIQSPKDFPALLRKLARGKTLAIASAEAGLTEEEARAHLEARTSEDDESLRSFADEAMRVSLRVLKKAALTEMRIVSEGFEMGHTKWEATDLKAATALLKAGMDARKMLRSKADKAVAGRDLFDGDGEDDGPWSFKDPD